MAAPEPPWGRQVQTDASRATRWARRRLALAWTRGGVRGPGTGVTTAPSGGDTPGWRLPSWTALRAALCRLHTCARAAARCWSRGTRSAPWVAAGAPGLLPLASAVDRSRAITSPPGCAQSPAAHGLRRTLRLHGDGAVALQSHQHRAVGRPVPERTVVHAEDSQASQETGAAAGGSCATGAGASR